MKNARLATALTAMVLLLFTGGADALYPPNGAKADGAGGYMNPDDGMCVIGLATDGTLLVDWSITNARDCVAWTKSADSSVDLVGLNTQDKCTKAGFAGNDGYKHTWSTSLCYDTTNNQGISRVDLDNSDAMCLSKGGTVVTTGKCVAYGWVYRNRKEDGPPPTLPISGSGISTTDGVQAADGLGFCYTAIRMTGGTYTSSTCPSYHNALATAPAGEWTAYGPGCLSSTSGCQSQASYDAGLGWSFASSNCVYSFGLKGTSNAAVTNAAGTVTAAGAAVDLTGYTNQGDCLADGFSWDNWLQSAGTTTKTSADGGDYAGMPAGAVIRRLDALTPVEAGGGEFFSGTGFTCLKCHSDQSRSYQERQKPGFVKTRHQKAGDDLSKPFSGYFTAGSSDWGLQGVQCAMCHSTAKPAQDDLIQVVPAGASGPPFPGDPKSATGHNQTEYGAHILDICYTCHGTAATPSSTNPASVIPVSGGDFALTGKGLAPIVNQFLNSPHAQYAGSSEKVDIGDKTKYASTFEGYVCRTAATQFRNNAAPGNSQANCEAANLTWYTATGFGSFCYYNQTSCEALPTGQWYTSFITAAYPWAAAAGGPGGVCAGIGIGSIITTVYRDGEPEKIHNLDSTTNAACTNPGDGTSTSGAAGFWVKDGETSPGVPTDTAQGNCMTCHDVHWALADTNPEAESFRRECTTCHVNAGSASGAPQIDLATINHLKTAGTPLEHWTTKPDEACETCHMPHSSEAAGTSPMHLWRINTDPAYATMGSTQANLAPSDDYAGAAWVDLDRACGQCHGGDAGAAKPGVPYFNKAQLAQVAEGIHDSSGATYGVTFSIGANGLDITTVASAECGGPCPAFTYDWDWGDGSAHGTGNPGEHTYASGGSKTIKLTLLSGGKLAGSSTRSITLANPDLPPTAAGTCTWDANTWKMTVVDASSDDGPDADGVPPDGNSTMKVVIRWGDSSSNKTITQGATASRTYLVAGTYTVTQTAIDSRLQKDVTTCDVDATPTPFQITGVVRRGANPVKSAVVRLRRNGTVVKTVYSAADGTFALRNLKPATYNLKVTKSGFTFPPALPITLGPDSLGNVITGTKP